MREVRQGMSGHPHGGVHRPALPAVRGPRGEETQARPQARGRPSVVRQREGGDGMNLFAGSSRFGKTRGAIKASVYLEAMIAVPESWTLRPYLPMRRGNGPDTE